MKNVENVTYFHKLSFENLDRTQVVASYHENSRF